MDAGRIATTQVQRTRVLGDWAEPILMETGLTRLGMLKQKHLGDLLSRHRKGEGDYANRLWTAMTLNLWYDRWIGSRHDSVPVVDSVHV